MLVYFASCMSNREFLQCSFDALDIPWRDSRKIVVCAGVFLFPVGAKGVSLKILLCWCIFLRAGATWHFCSVP